MTMHLPKRPFPILFPVLFALVLGVSVGFLGCKKKKPVKKGPTVVKIDWKKKWDKINSDGEMGKFHIKRGLGIVSGATTAEGKDKGYTEMVEGYRTIMEASSRADDLLDTIKDRDPGRSFPQWEKTMASWTEEAMKVRKNLPLDYIDKLNED
jgi:hypothetical protein